MQTAPRPQQFKGDTLYLFCIFHICNILFLDQENKCKEEVNGLWVFIFSFVLRMKQNLPLALASVRAPGCPSAVLLLTPGGSHRVAEDPVRRGESVTWLSMEFCSKESGCSFPDSVSGGVLQVCGAEQEFRGETP